jgi:hypothetical protein
MIAEPKCYSRGCQHFMGVSRPDGTEASERAVCKAFPDGIPDEIAYGDDLHTKVKDGQVGQYVFAFEQKWL